MLGFDNFNDYYPVSLKRARQAQLLASGVYTVDGDLNDRPLLPQLFGVCRFTHVLHLAAQARTRAMPPSPCRPRQWGFCSNQILNMLEGF